ncbi:exostosin family-domain-containing protein [Pelagophyceae sp. CCMP2097]|nr:exostosin family-domain-containing protein [Pelagophyceae sp. CCMP2097]|mmetsp:Transcript_22099/g.74898  ORF Transcript_22099/g.74898 Transcript_22099/m.74898 type:complete len:533 (+) Transcript_22099:98-1696(+)
MARLWPWWLLVPLIAAPDCSSRKCAFVNSTRRAACGPAPPQTDCPKVFIYADLGAALYDADWRPSAEFSCDAPVRPGSNIVNRIFGTLGVEKRPNCAVVPSAEWGTYYASQQWRGAEMLLYRAATSLRCPRTFDPAEADLFLVPVLPASKSSAEWTRLCGDRRASESALVARLPHLNNKTAHRHLLVFGKGLANAKPCGWFIQPKTLLKRAQRFAYSAKVLLPKSDYDARRTKPRYGPVLLPYVPKGAVYWSAHLDRAPELREDLHLAPNLVSIPYPSSIHASRDTDASQAPWRARPASKRRILMSFQGRLAKEEQAHEGADGAWLQDKHYGAAVRAKIDDLCGALPDNVCLVDNLYFRQAGDHTVVVDKAACFRNLQRRDFHPESLEVVKGQSTFCLEPLGDSPYRKSIWDSLSLGCIPVVFSLYSEVTAPWHWGSWRNLSRVYIPEADLLDEKFDLVSHLRAIPDDMILAMQRNIAANINRIMFAVDDLPFDAYEVLVRRAALEATAFERRGVPDLGEEDTGQWLDVGIS